jgi:transcriptional regulator with XRE-family HTH domain
MVTASRVPALEPTAKLLREAMEAKGVTSRALSAVLGCSWNTVYNRAHARARVSVEAAQRMAHALDVPWEPLVSPVPPKGEASKKARKAKPGAKPGRPGPASRALALHEAARPPVPLQPTPASTPVPRPTPVLAFELWSDGTSTIALKTQLSADRGGALLRQLLDFGLAAKA